LDVTGSVTAGSVDVSGNLTATSVDILSSLTVTGNVDSGNVSGTTIAGTNLIGTLQTADQPNVTSVGTLESLTLTGNLSAGNVIAEDVSATAFTGTRLSLTGNATVENITATSITGFLTAAAQSGITSIGTLSSLTVTGNVDTGNVIGTTVTGTNLFGTLQTPAQPNVTTVGTLDSLAVSGNIAAGNVSTDIYTGTRLSITGNATIGNVLIVNSATGKVGIGTSSPAFALDVAGIVSTDSTMRVGPLVGRHVEIQANTPNNAYIDFHSKDGSDVDYDARIISTGGTNNTIGEGALTFQANNYTYAGAMYNNSSTASVGVVRVRAYPLYPALGSGQSIRSYDISHRTWSGKMPKNGGSYTLSCYGNGNYPLYGTYNIQYQSKGGALATAIRMCMQGNSQNPGNTNLVTWTNLASTNAQGAGGGSGLFTLVFDSSNWLPLITFTNNTPYHGYFIVHAVVFDDTSVFNDAQ
jgi:hypothetical protein